MKKQLTWVLAFAALFPAFSQDRISGFLEHYVNGGNRESNNPYNYTTLELDWEKVLSPTLTFNMDVSGEADWSFPENNSFATGDVSRLSLEYVRAPLTVDAGRVHFFDSTGYILDLNLDGFKAAYSISDFFTVRGGAGYSGLTFDHATGLVKTSQESTEDNLLTPSRVVGYLQGSYRDENGMEGNVHVYGQTNLKGSDDPLLLIYAGTYGSVTAGDFLFSLDYTFSGGTVGASYMGDVYENYTTSHLVYGEAGYYPSALRDRGVKVVLTGFFTSGDTYDVREENMPGAASTVEPDGSSSLFIPISRTSLGKQLGDQAGNLAFVRLEAGYVPLKGRFDENILGAALGSSVYMRTANGPIQAYGLNSLSNSSYLGTEFNGKLTFRPFSDLGLTIDNQFFLPDVSSGGAFEGNRNTMEYALEVVLTLSI